MELVPLVGLATLVGKFLDFFRYIQAKDWNGVTTQALAWAAGVVGVFLAKYSDFASAITFGDVNLADANNFTAAFVGLIATSVFSTMHDFKKAFDGSDSAKQPALTRLKGGESRATQGWRVNGGQRDEVIATEDYTGVYSAKEEQ